jgi:hypothetical protein
MKRIISFISHNQQTKKIITQKKRKTKYHIAETKENKILIGSVKDVFEIKPHPIKSGSDTMLNNIRK